MKRNVLFILGVFLLTIGMIAFPQGYTLAQEPVCTDAAGNVIPCPPTAEVQCGQAGGPACPPIPNNSGGNNGSTKPTATFPPATLTPTALPISAAPTATPKEGYLGQCTPQDDFFACKEKFVCEDGLFVIEVDLYTEGGTTYDFYCIPNENIPQLNLPFAVPTSSGPQENWGADCSGNNGGKNLTECLDIYSEACTLEGGDVSIWYDPGGEGAGFYCENESEASQPAPEATPFPLVVAPQTGDTSGEDWDESCSWASCFAYDIMCWADGGSGYGQDDGAGNTVYHCDMPEGKTQNNLKRISIAVIIVTLIVIGLLIRRARNRRVELKISY